MSQASGLIPRIRALQTSVAAAAHPYVLLLVRVLFGYALFRAGWGKLGNLDQVTQAFTHLGIPMPGINAVVVAILEAAGGLFIMAGLATRISAAVLTVVLIVAALTAHGAELAQGFANPGAFVGASPVPYVAVLLLLGVTGAGKLSVDHALAGRAS